MHTDAAGNRVVPVDQLLRLLADGSRRRLLSELAERPDGSLTVDELRMSLLVDSDLSGRQIQQELHHRHLPALSDAGLVSMEEDHVRYRPDPRAEQLLATIDAIS